MPIIPEAAQTIPLNLFYEEPEGDRWIRFDRFPRRLIRRIVRGPPQPSGQRLVFLNLCAGLKQLGIPYRTNDYRHAARHPEELVCIVGKCHVLLRRQWKNRIILGPSIECHPLDAPDLLSLAPIRAILMHGAWVTEMSRPYWGDKVVTWAVGIDTDKWSPIRGASKTIDVLIYDKVRWFRDRYEEGIIGPIRAELARRKLRVREIRYGHYRDDELLQLARSSQAMIFLCEHETQGLAYQQVLSCGVPIFAWDRGGYWQDPAYFPNMLLYEPVTSVPYWDGRCGSKFADLDEFNVKIDGFLAGVRAGTFLPRSYILENLTLAECARQYLAIVRNIECSDA